MRIEISSSHNGKLTQLKIGDIMIHFSYETPIQYYTPETGIVTTENVWGPTTGRHLNAISNPQDRIPWKEFQDRITQDLGQLQITRQNNTKEPQP